MPNAWRSDSWTVSTFQKETLKFKIAIDHYSWKGVKDENIINNVLDANERTIIAHIAKNDFQQLYKQW